jgi:predicted NUDIX family phosphoesterase
MRECATGISKERDRVPFHWRNEQSEQVLIGIFLDSAYKVLARERRPLSVQEITEIALQEHFLSTDGATPWQTMKAKLSVDILQHRERSLFMRSDKAKFALREWSHAYKEHIADRYQKALFDEDIVVFPSESLRTYVPSVGVYSGSFDHDALLSECFPMRRREAEEDISVIQLVSVFLVRYDGRLLTYKRTKRLPESRLHGYYSVAFGGHLNPDDVLHLFNIFDASQAHAWLVRELHEELRIGKGHLGEIAYRGLLYDDSREVSKQHLGLVYDVNLKSEQYTIGERGFLMDSKFETIDEICARIDQFENWSVMLVREEQRIRDVNARHQQSA